MRSSRLQLILDRQTIGEGDILQIARELISAGIDMIQYRDKVSSDKVRIMDARSLRAVTREGACALIINDRPDIAALSDADGVHLGQDDLSITDARKIVGPKRAIGISTHNIDQARRAEAAGADYIGVGPIFTTPTKPDLAPIGLEIVETLAKEINIPVFFIGGIDLNNIEELIERGTGSVAIASAILKSGNIRVETSKFIEVLGKVRHEG